jgi:uncharacterized protein (TIGR02147 family)
MPNIVDYMDYRRFLEDYYLHRKSEDGNYSYQLLSQSAGNTSKGFLFNVIKGRRKLSSASIVGLAYAMKLSSVETAYFEALVAFNDATGTRARNHHLQRLLSIKGGGRHDWQPQMVRRDQYRFYQQHHHSVIRSLIEMHGFNGDYDALAAKVWPRITARKARSSVALLVKLGMLRKTAGGKYRVTNACISTPPEMSATVLQDFHLEAGKLALRALEELPPKSRNVTSLTLGISREAYETIREELASCRRRLLELANDDQNADSVYQLNMQLFEVSRQPAEDGK